VQDFVSFDERNLHARRLRHLGVVSGIGCAVPGAMRGEDFGVMEGLRV